MVVLVPKAVLFTLGDCWKTGFSSWSGLLVADWSRYRTDEDGHCPKRGGEDDLTLDSNKQVYCLNRSR
jgi:hypothetical protein